MQSPGLKSIEQVENLRETQRLPGFPTLFTHERVPARNGEADEASVGLACWGKRQKRFVEKEASLPIPRSNPAYLLEREWKS